MKAQCYICHTVVEINSPAAIKEFGDRFEGEKITEAVVLCSNCDDDIKNSDTWVLDLGAPDET